MEGKNSTKVCVIGKWVCLPFFIQRQWTSCNHINLEQMHSDVTHTHISQAEIKKKKRQPITMIIERHVECEMNMRSSRLVIALKFYDSDEARALRNDHKYMCACVCVCVCTRQRVTALLLSHFGPTVHVRPIVLKNIIIYITVYDFASLLFENFRWHDVNCLVIFTLFASHTTL